MTAAFARVSLREPTKLNQLGLGRLKETPREELLAKMVSGAADERDS
jgi:hypothetical protein